jgi:3-deoxy-D-manno-octulosonic-acid transferase
MLDRLLELDLSLFYLINHGLKSPLLDRVMPYFSDFGFFILPLVIFGLFALYKWKLKALWIMLIVGAAVGLTDTLSFYGLKSTIARLRPYHVLDNVNVLKEWGYSSSFSFPSSHSANVFAIATVMGWFYPKTTFILIPTALMVALSRVYGGVHYPLDTLGGAVLGITCASMAIFVSSALKTKWEDMKIKGKVTGDEGYFILYTLLAPLALFYFIPKLVKEKEGREKFWERFGHIDIDIDIVLEKPLWLHAASVGEVMVAKTLIETIKEKTPDLPIFLTVNTPAGRSIAENSLPDIPVAYFPFDFPWAVKRVLRRVSPRAVVLIEAEIWPNFIRITKNLDIPTILVNGRMSESTHRSFKKINPFAAGVLSRLSAIVSQSDGYRERYLDLGCLPKNVFVSGNIKYDMVYEHEELKGDIKKFISNIKGNINRKSFLAGSTRRGEEEVVLDAFSQLKELSGKSILPFLVLAPRHLNRIEEVESLLKRVGAKYIKRSDLAGGSAGVITRDVDILLLDTIGELPKLMAAADVVFIGGSLIKGIGGHNVLEPAAVKRAPIFGPYMNNFPEISKDLVNAGGGFVVVSAMEMVEIARRLMEDEGFATKAGEGAYSVVEKNRGATMKCVEIILPFVDGAGEN